MAPVLHDAAKKAPFLDSAIPALMRCDGDRVGLTPASLRSTAPAGITGILRGNRVGQQ